MNVKSLETAMRAYAADVVRDLERALADEKQCARLTAECHTREIRQLEDAIEAEAEARREAERECERLREAVTHYEAAYDELWDGYRVDAEEKMALARQSRLKS